jgi:hypothetical protein
MLKTRHQLVHLINPVLSHEAHKRTVLSAHAARDGLDAADWA